LRYCEVITKKTGFRIRGSLHNIEMKDTHGRIRDRSYGCRVKIAHHVRIGSWRFIEKIHPIPMNIEEGSSIEPMRVHPVHDSNNHCIHPGFPTPLRWKTCQGKRYKGGKDAILPGITGVAGPIVTTGTLFVRNVVSGIITDGVQEISFTNIHGGLHRLMPRCIAKKMENMKFAAFAQEKEDR